MYKYHQPRGKFMAERQCAQWLRCLEAIPYWPGSADYHELGRISHLPRWTVRKLISGRERNGDLLLIEDEQERLSKVYRLDLLEITKPSPG